MSDICGKFWPIRGNLSCRPLKVKALTQLFGIKGHADILPGLTALPKEVTSD